MKICGIDEAGRGPVIGPLVIAGACFDEKDLPELVRLNVRDSKLVPEKKRKELFNEIIKLAHSYKIIIVPADEIDSTNAKGINLNHLEAIKAAEIISELKPDVVYVDSPTSPDAKTFAKYIRDHLDFLPKDIHAEHKADVNHREASAASILAKVTRDAEIEKIKKEVKLDFGSGYSADPITKKFVEEHWENTLAKYIRHSWGNIKKLKHLKAQQKLNFQN
ncbi:MAG: ribonuclease HII [Nanoarchaeota archaeon]